ncbi:MAG: NUDIX domain-containing protein [Clostridia bacterium]|nr:NUDIX domain-containing protein [Clostridia bacterium]
MEIIREGEPFTGRYDFRETCFGIVECDGQILLVRKKGQFSFPGGGIEENESFEDCLAREFEEEAGYTVKSIKELVCVDCFWFTWGNYPMNTKANMFVVEVDMENIGMPTEEGHEVFWVPTDEVLNLLPLPYHKAAMKYYLEQKD